MMETEINISHQTVATSIHLVLFPSPKWLKIPLFAERSMPNPKPQSMLCPGQIDIRVSSISMCLLLL